MKPISIWFGNPSNRHENLRKAFEFAGIEFSSVAKIDFAGNGKPVLALNSKDQVGYSLSHSQNIEAIALLDEARDIGIDLEIWPQRKADPIFLETVAAAEDGDVLNQLGLTGFDAGVALWVIKEAALKCTGDVMTDPRDLAVKHFRSHTFNVSPSAAARSPHPEIDVLLYVLKNEHDPNFVLLCAAAMPVNAWFHQGTIRVVEFDAANWKVAKFGQ